MLCEQQRGGRDRPEIESGRIAWQQGSWQYRCYQIRGGQRQKREITDVKEGNGVICLMSVVVRVRSATVRVERTGSQAK